MTVELAILGLVVVTALAFDFTNGFHDTGNAMATSIATGALKPKVAVGISAILNLVGAFLSVEVAATITNPYQKARALTSVAQALAAAGHTDQARQVAATIAASRPCVMPI